MPAPDRALDLLLGEALPGGVLRRVFPIRELGLEVLGIHERRAVDQAVDRRRNEFASGRLAARELLAALGTPVDDLPVGEDRAPSWPPSVVGSLTHAGEWGVVLTALRRQFRGLGVDLEPWVPLEASLFRRIITEGEQETLEFQPWASRGLLGKAHFSAKEAVFKAWWPQTHSFLEFHDVEIEWRGSVPGLGADGHSYDFTARIGRLEPRLRSYGCLAVAAGYCLAWVIEPQDQAKD